MDEPSAHSQTIEKTATEARQGRTTGHVRWILALSFFGAIAAMGLVYWAVIG